MKQLTVLEFTQDEERFIQDKIKIFIKYLIHIRLMAEEAYKTEKESIDKYGKTRGKIIFAEIGKRTKRNWAYIKDDLKKQPNKITQKYLKEHIKTTRYKLKHKGIKDTKTAVEHKEIKGDFFSEIKQIKREFDLIYIDPPYNILREEWDDFESKEKYKLFTKKWLDLCLPKLKDNGRIYINFSQWFMFDFYEWMKKHCKKYDLVFSNMLIWNYKNNMKPHNKKFYKYTYEPIFYYRKKNAPELIDQQDFGEERLDVWTIAIPQTNYNGDRKVHPAQKPKELMERIILTGCPEGGWVLDPFAGSGTTGVVCKNNKRNFILIENNEGYYKMIVDRLKNG